jgi:hypothetical protein
VQGYPEELLRFEAFLPFNLYDDISMKALLRNDHAEGIIIL